MPYSSWSQDDYTRAYRFAADAHNGQMVPGTSIPYIMHVSVVCMEVIAALRSEPDHDQNLAVQCSLLHDVIEDTQVRHERLTEVFGSAVAAGVLALTKNKKLDNSEQMADSLQRIRQQPRTIWMVKLADRISNLQAPPFYWPRQKIADYRAEAVQIRDALGKASVALSVRLAGKIEAYARYL
jgi:(p)ppGpp synthase/HD superfamily hydrolase